jgi:Ser/Thr protein kinase RdoA (MazF antagonist)
MENVYVDNLESIISSFPFMGQLRNIEKTNTGLINCTYILTFSDGNQEFKYVLQQINTNVFHNPDELMSNIMNVTGFLRNKIILEGRNPERETLTFLYTNNNSPYYHDKYGKFWRAYNYISNCYTCDCIDEPVKALRSGKAFGHFQKLLADYPIDNLFETIPDFHNTPVRYTALKEAIEKSTPELTKYAEFEIEFALNREKDAHKLTDLLKSGELPLRVTHNDTKINNVLFDKITHEAFCVIDLDTVMPGLSLYDFGDSIRSSAVTSDENEKDLSKYGLSLELFNSYSEGYILEAGSALTKTEAELLPFSAKLMALECGVRFLTDYLSGDTYFKTEYPEHNLVRCKTQFKLVSDIEKNIDTMKKTTAELYRRALLES